MVEETCDDKNSDGISDGDDENFVDDKNSENFVDDKNCDNVSNDDDQKSDESDDIVCVDVEKVNNPRKVDDYPSWFYDCAE